LQKGKNLLYLSTLGILKGENLRLFITYTRTATCQRIRG
jgi:hypothetical protein